MEPLGTRYACILALPGSITAVQPDICPVDIQRLISAQEVDYPRNFLRLGELPRRYSGLIVLSSFLVRPSFLPESCPDGPRRNTVRCDAMSAPSTNISIKRARPKPRNSPLRCHTPRQPNHPSLTSTIRPMIMQRHMARLTRQIDNAPSRCRSSASQFHLLRSFNVHPRERLADQCRAIEVDHVMLQQIFRRSFF